MQLSLPAWPVAGFQWARARTGGRRLEASHRVAVANRRRGPEPWAARPGPLLLFGIMMIS